MSKESTRTILYTTGALLAVATVVYAYVWFHHVARADQRALLLGAYIRSTVPGLRTPQYREQRKRDLSDSAFTALSSGLSGACNYITLQDCQAFSLSAAILEPPTRLTELLRFLDRPCSGLSDVPLDFKEPSGERVRDQHKLAAITAAHFFGCAGAMGGPRKLILNVVDGVDTGEAFRSNAAPLLRFRITKQYR